MNADDPKTLGLGGNPVEETHKVQHPAKASTHKFRVVWRSDLPPKMPNDIDRWTTDHREWYRSVYLASEHWADLRRRKLARNPTCELCGKSGQMDIHHVNYRRIFDVQLHDLLTLCRKCHDEEHATNGNPKRIKRLPNDRDVTPCSRYTKARRKRDDYRRWQAIRAAKRSPVKPCDPQSVLRFNPFRELRIL